MRIITSQKQNPTFGAIVIKPKDTKKIKSLLSRGYKDFADVYANMEVAYSNNIFDKMADLAIMAFKRLQAGKEEGRLFWIIQTKENSNIEQKTLTKIISEIKTLKANWKAEAVTDEFAQRALDNFSKRKSK